MGRCFDRRHTILKRGSFLTPINHHLICVGRITFLHVKNGDFCLFETRAFELIFKVLTTLATLLQKERCQYYYRTYFLR